MLGLLLGAATAAVSVTGFGYFVHRFLHKPVAKLLNGKHMVHHEELYPSGDFFSEVYRSAGKDSTVIIFVIAGSPMLLLPVGFWLVGAIDLFTTVATVGMMGAVGYLHNYLHDSFHVKDHWLNRFDAFKRLVALHQVHHDDMTKNFGIFTFLWDKAFKTFQDK